MAEHNDDNIFDSMSLNDPSSRVRLRVLGLSYSQIRNGAYALILAQVGGPYRIPVVIGPSEAQSIAVRIEGITPPRPLTHDLFSSLGKAFGIELTEVFIYKFADGVFYSEMTYTDGERTVTIDSRTSDAVALAMRNGAPIFTTRQVLEETGFELDESDFNHDSSESDDAGADTDEINVDDDSATADSHDVTPVRNPKLENYSLEELHRTLRSLIEREEYEQAARVAEIIKRKEQNL